MLNIVDSSKETRKLFSSQCCCCHKDRFASNKKRESATSKVDVKFANFSRTKRIAHLFE